VFSASCHVIDLSIYRAPVEEAGRLFFVEERRQLPEDASERRTLITALRGERRRAVKEQCGKG
jgi:hypothetical protein